jgi:hypothetical protein
MFCKRDINIAEIHRETNFQAILITMMNKKQNKQKAKRLATIGRKSKASTQ